MPRARLAVAVEPILNSQSSLSFVFGRGREDWAVILGDLFAGADRTYGTNDHGGADEVPDDSEETVSISLFKISLGTSVPKIFSILMVD